jgi:hypothetical protein
MMDVTIPVIHKTGINKPVVAIIVKIVNFMMTPSFSSLPDGLRWLIGDSHLDLALTIAYSALCLLYSINHAKIQKPV